MTRKPPRFIPPANDLKLKVGDGGIPASLIKKGQDYMDSNPVDFTPYGLDLLKDLKHCHGSIVGGDYNEDAVMTEITNIVMQLKSNGSMFHYSLISMTSDVILRFLEKVARIDEDFIEILTVYVKALSIILGRKLTGDGGREGHALTQELNNACARYYRKKGIG